MLELGQMLVSNVVKWDISNETVSMMEINHHLISKHQNSRLQIHMTQ